MPHYPQPFFKPSRRTWYVQLHGKQINLGPNRESAFQRYHDLMRNANSPRAELHIGGSLAAITVIDEFLESLSKTAGSRTFEWYRRHLQHLADGLPDTLSLTDLIPRHVTKIVEARKRWNATTRNGFCRAAKRAFQWAEDEGLIAKSPLRKLKKPTPHKREIDVTAEEYRAILDACQSDAGRDLITLAWETGARPQELVAFARRHLELARERLVLPAAEAKGKKLPRIIYLSPKALDVCRRNAVLHSTGPLLRTQDEEAWSRNSVSQLFRRIQLVMGRIVAPPEFEFPEKPRRFHPSHYATATEAKFAEKNHRRVMVLRRLETERRYRALVPRFTLYHFRHAFATRAIQRGVDPLTVGILLGHKDPSMIAKVYAHVAQDHEYLSRSARRVTAAGAEVVA